MVKLRYTPDEISRLGDELYERNVLPNITAEDGGRFVAIDVESGAFEIGADELSAAHGLLARKPDAQVWLQRVGVPYLHRFSPRIRPRHGRPA